MPTLAEMARIKAWLLVTRHTTRDYLDTVVLCERLGEASVAKAFEHLDQLYAQDSGGSVLSEVVERLAMGVPSDRARVDLGTYRGLQAPWNDWQHLVRCGRRWAEALAHRALTDSGGET